MTTIVYRDGVMAADTLITANSKRIGSSIKIGRKGRVLFGAAGSLGYVQSLLDWCNSGFHGNAPPLGDKDDSAQGIVVLQPYVVSFMYDGVDRVKADRWAIGSGGEVASGALAAGASALETVKAAIEVDCYSGGEITVLWANG